MGNLYISLLIIFAAFGAFCFNMGHRRAYRVVLKALLKGQIEFLAQRTSFLTEKGEKASRDELAKAYVSYETIGHLILAWYKYFRIVRDDKELKALKVQIKRSLEEYLALIEAADTEEQSRVENS
jgi:hypothetical protein